MIYRKSLTISILLTLAVSFGACAGTKENNGSAEVSSADDSKDAAAEGTHNESENKGSAKTANVQTQEVTLGSLTQSALAHGVTMADHHVVYSAEIAGKIEHLGFELGAEVKKGRTLARIDFKTLKAQAEQAQSAADLADATLKRIAKLMKDGLISQQQYDEAYSNAVGSKAQLAIAEANVSKSIVKANHYGVVSAKYVEKSEYVGPGTRLYEIVDYRTVIVEAQLAESQVASVSPGSKVEVRIDALNETFNGTVDTILPTADAMSKTFTARVRIPNPDLKILVGMSAKLNISAQNFNDVVIAPQSAILEEQSGVRSAFVVQNNVAQKREVLLGAYQGGNVVVTEGLKPGDQLVVLGQRDLLDGQPVHIMK
ncbi:MAG: efflux RND transporter periplasmic adaptor subunit [Deltaproteobacteria bacterium]|nr:efflux RND transporter periplasmic adaptor subunit [Deltaproteobacteria bacterium]MBN2670924.1 efflux RND transporter periplasmic adaptor subunit [Deltaproteobacteria bacterium]